jgi:hypothetical protein
MPGGASRCREAGACPTRRERKTREGASINAGENTPYLIPRCFDGRHALGRWVKSAGTTWESPFWKLLTRKKTISMLNFYAAILGLELGQSHVHSPHRVLKSSGINMDLEMVTRADNSFHTYQNMSSSLSLLFLRIITLVPITQLIFSSLPTSRSRAGRLHGPLLWNTGRHCRRRLTPTDMRLKRR